MRVHATSATRTVIVALGFIIGSFLSAARYQLSAATLLDNCRLLPIAVRASAPAAWPSYSLFAAAFRTIYPCSQAGPTLQGAGTCPAHLATSGLPLPSGAPWR